MLCHPVYQRRIILLHGLGARPAGQFLAERALEHKIQARFSAPSKDYRRPSPTLLAARHGARLLATVRRVA